MPELITHEEKLRRLQFLQAKQEQIQSARLEQWVGRTAEVLIDNYNRMDERCFQGRISQNLVVNFTKPYEGLALGSLVKAKIIGRKRYTLVGEIEG
jgi:tRNA A37 methylthiotransferase MiaB